MEQEKPVALSDEQSAGPSGQHPIIITNLSKTFGEQTVLKGISFHVERGQTLVVLGRSGTGKSVLLKVIVGLQKADAGSVQISGETIGDLDRDHLNQVRKRIGFLFQHAALYDSLTLEENVAFPLARHSDMPENERRKKARELLASVGMDGDTEKMPSQISGGMQKRVGLARALALEPEIVLFDEPMAGLDPITAAEIGELIVKHQKERGMTSVVVTHDVRGAKLFSDRFVVLDNGAIVAEGTFADLQKSQNPLVARFVKDGSKEG